MGAPKPLENELDPNAPVRLPAHMPQLDGVRALAILAVIHFHLALPGGNLGWAGVQLFFVLSGFLITGILLKTREKPGYYRAFYGRRALRIFPVYYLALAAMALVAAAMGWSHDHLGLYVLYLQNYLQGATHFEQGLPIGSHTWSLAIEEQFYLLWPFVVQRVAPRRLGWVLGGMGLFALALRLVAMGSWHSPYLAYTPLPTAFDTLGAGAALALAIHLGVRRRTLLRFAAIGGTASILGLAAIVHGAGWAAMRFPEQYLGADQLPNALLYTWLGLGSTAFLAWILVARSWVTRLLESRILRHIGQVSYGLYMFHGPVLAFFQSPEVLAWAAAWPVALRRAVFLVAKLGGSYLLTRLSWALLEQPLLKLKDVLFPSSGAPKAEAEAKVEPAA